LDSAGEVFVASAGDGERDVFQSEESPCCFHGLIALGIDHVEDFPDSVGGRDLTRFRGWSRKLQRNRKTGNSDFGARDSFALEHLGGGIVRDEIRVGSWLEPNRVDRDRIGDDGRKGQVQIELASGALEDRAVAREGAHDYAGFHPKNRVAHPTGGAPVKAQSKCGQARESVEELVKEIPSPRQAADGGFVGPLGQRINPRVRLAKKVMHRDQNLGMKFFDRLFDVTRSSVVPLAESSSDDENGERNHSRREDFSRRGADRLLQSGE